MGFKNISLFTISIFVLALNSHAEQSCIRQNPSPSNPSYASCGGSEEKEIRFEILCRLDPYGPPMLEQLKNCKEEKCAEHKCSVTCKHPGKPKCTSDNETTRKCQLIKERESCSIRWDGEPRDNIQRGTLEASIKCQCECRPLNKKSTEAEAILDEGASSY